MFQFSGFATIRQIFNLSGFPIRTRADISVVCTSPHIFAAYRVLRRLQEPRHPPYALVRFLLCAIHPYRQNDIALQFATYFKITRASLTHSALLLLLLYFSPSLVNELFNLRGPLSNTTQANEFVQYSWRKLRRKIWTRTTLRSLSKPLPTSKISNIPLLGPQRY